jgi:hypothetical protein
MGCQRTSTDARVLLSPRENMMSSLQRYIPLSRNTFRYLCLLTALANGLGNVFLLLFYRLLFDWLGVPFPLDLHSFAWVAGLSFTMGVLALLVFLNPERNVNLLIIGIVGKGIYAFFTLYFYVFKDLHWFYLLFGIWDALYVVIFFLFLIQLLAPDLGRLNRGDILVGLDRERTNKALILTFSLTGTGRTAAERAKIGMERRGYTVDVQSVQAEEKIFRFPMALSDFVRIVLRAFLRWPARIRPLGIGADHPYDLIVVATQTWLVGMGAPMEAVFQHPDHRGIFDGRDVAALNVCRGAWRRSQAMLVRWLERSGGNVVGVRAYTHIGWEPSRLFSLWFYLIFKEAGRPRVLDGFVQPRYGLSDEALGELERFGEDLAERKRVVWYRSTVA